jgi:hypothetical protein
LDESGDLGFDLKKKRTSKFFVVTLLFVPGDKRSIEKVVRKTHGELSRNIKRLVGSLHATNEKPITRQRLLRRLSQNACSVMTIYLDKRKVFTNMRDEKQVLYNYIVNILLDKVMKNKILQAKGLVELIASRRETNRFFNKNFENYLQQQAKKWPEIKITIKIKSPHEERALQATDFVSWAIFRKYENNDDSYYSIIKPKIIEERAIFP